MRDLLNAVCFVRVWGGKRLGNDPENYSVIINQYFLTLLLVNNMIQANLPEIIDLMVKSPFIV